VAGPEGGALECVGVEGRLEGVDDRCMVSPSYTASLGPHLMGPSVPISKLPTLVRETSEDMERRGITACHLGSVPLLSCSTLTDVARHVGDGNVHSLALFSNEKELAVVREAVHDMVRRAIRLDGTCTGEHGVGVGKVEYLEEELGVGTVNLLETVKRTCESQVWAGDSADEGVVDPFNLMNPGKVGF